MPDNNNAVKGRLLFLEHYLQNYTDENHTISTDELIDLYTANGFKANRNTIRDDIEVLLTYGVDVIKTYKGKARAYYLGNRIFDLAEVKTLVDAVSSARFITSQKSEALIQKLSLLTSVHNRENLTHSAFVAERLKTITPSVFVYVDKIDTAISNGQKIRFQYIDFLPDKTEVLRHDGKVYVVSPQALLWNDDRYYAPSYSEEKDCIIPFRVDRMRNVAVVSEDAVRDEKFSVSDYTRKVMKMYDGSAPEQNIVLVADNKHMLSIIDRFGMEVETEVLDDKHFKAVVSVCPSSTFFAWVFQFGGGIRVEGPEDVKNRYREMLSSIISMQDNSVSL